MKTRAHTGFTTYEMIGAMAVLMLVFSCFYASLRGVHELQTAFENERNAVVLLNNVVERLEADRKRDLEKARLLLNDEFGKSALSVGGRFSPFCRASENGVIAVGVMKTSNGQSLAKLDFTK